MKLSAEIIFKLNGKPQVFQLVPYGDSKPWRYLADNCAVELVPVCDSEARPINDPPCCCDRLEIWPVQWGYPDSLVSEHPGEVEQMRQAHLAGDHDLINGNHTWKHWLENYGKADLWHSFRTPEMERFWLTWQTWPGSSLNAFAGLTGRIKRVVGKLIKFRADFYSGDECQTIFLSGCHCAPLTQAEIRNSPKNIAEQKQLADKQVAIETISARKINSERKLVTEKLKLEKVKVENRKEEHRASLESARQPVTRAQVIDAFNVKTDRGVRKICTRHEVKWPQNKGELDQLKIKHLRHKKNLGEKLAKKNKVRSANRRGIVSDTERNDFE